MACASVDGLGWRRRRQRHHLQPETKDEEEEEDELAGCGGQDAALDVGSVDCWHLSSSPEIPEDVELLEELANLLDEGEQNFDLTDVHDLDHMGHTEPRSPPSENGGHPGDDGNPEDVAPVSYWEGQLAVMEEDQDAASSEDLETQRRAWDAGSEEETDPNLSYEVQYGSEYSASPEALKDPLALYRRGKSDSLTSNGGEDFSGHSSLSPSPAWPLPEGHRLKTEVFETHCLLGGSLGPSQDLEFSSPSGRSPESGTLSSPAASARWNQSFLGHLSVEDLQNVPDIEAETFPESPCTENLGGPMGTVVGADNTDRRGPFIATKQEERRSDPVGGMALATRLGARDDRRPESGQKLKADVPHGLPSKFTRQSRSLSPRGRASRKTINRSSSGEADRATRSTPATSESPRYGQGQLNYPLPDLSKVEPRVRFPKDPRRYRPPRGKTRPARPNESGKPVVFKSPAEIVREVLLSSGEGSPQKCPTPTVSVIPEELKSPRQATELVHQLQEDYRRLLTKYAEAENTIDRLRLATKVRLYVDPPKPSQEMQMGMLPPGSKVMTFSIPQARVAGVSGSPAPGLDAAWKEDAGSLAQRATFSPLATPTVSDIPSADGHMSMRGAVSEDRLTRVLANQARTFQRQVELMEELIQAGRLTPQDQLKGFARLKEAQSALEQAYLQAREEHQRLEEPTRIPGDFDPDRAVEGEIFRLEMRLQELKDRIGQASLAQPATGSDSEMATSSFGLPARTSESPMRSPTPSIQAPIPAVRTPYPEAPIPKDSHSQAQVDVEVSSVSDETEGDAEGLPEPLWRKHLQTEKDFDHLLDCYSSFKSLPEALSLEQLNLEGRGLGPEEVDGAAPEDAGTQNDPHSEVAEGNDTPRSASKVSQEREPPVLLPRNPQQPNRQVGHMPTSQVEGSSENCRPSTVAPRAASRRKQEPLSPRSSLASVVESAVSEHASRKALRRTGTAPPEDARIVSPETDSGFVGSEASRVSPPAQPPRRRSSHASGWSRLNPSGEGLEENMWPSRRCKMGSVMPHPCLAPGSLGMGAELGLPGRLVVPTTLQPAAQPGKGPNATETLVMGSTPEGTTHQQRLANYGSFALDSPPRWTQSIASEQEADTDGTHSEDRDGLDASPPSELRCSPSSSLSLSPARTRSYSLLGSRLERDQAIVALQNEVSQLRRSLEETLHRPPGSPKRSSLPHTSRAWVPSSQGSARFSKSSTPKGKTFRENLANSEDPAPEVKLEEWTRRASLSQDGVQLDRAPSESEGLAPTHRNVSASKTKSPKQPVLRGPYTGTQYSFLTPEPQQPKAGGGSTSCPPGQEEQSQPREETTPEQDVKDCAGALPPRNSFGPSQPSTPRKTAACLRCKRVGSPQRKVVHGTEDISAQGIPSSQPQPQQPGLWYVAVPPPTASVGYVAAIPVTPYQPTPVRFCAAAPAPTSASPPAGLPIFISPGPQVSSSSSKRHREHLCLQFDLDARCDLDRSLSWALDAAEGLKLTTKRMSRTLASELDRARSLRGSCLF